MKKTLLLLACILFLLGSVSAAQFHSVPLDNPSYRIIENAEERGILPMQSDVKPYNLNTVRSLLEKVIASDRITPSEKKTAEQVLADLIDTYGAGETTSVHDLLQNGAYRSTAPKTSTAFGVRASSVQTAGKVINGENVFDSRNSIYAYAMGDVASYLSYDLNFRVSMEKIDIHAHPLTDLELSNDGFYMDLSNRGDRMKSLPDDHFYSGIENNSEISSSLLDDLVSLRIGTVKRDWGPGTNNLQFSGSARAFDGYELAIRPSSWFTYSVVTGSLGQLSLDTVNGVEWPSESMDNKTGAYNNNVSAHRVEIGPFYGIKASIWESVVWRKRFELAYLNPFTIYMFSQNSLGDYDNVLAGADFTWNIPGCGTLYAGFGLDEMSNSHLFTNPRNVVPVEMGYKAPLPFLNYTVVNFQFTYIPAFWGAHYSSKDALFGDVYYTVPYLNKGQNLSYPVNPDTMEILLSLSSTLNDGTVLSATIKDQMRSAQYASKTTGTDVLTYMSYSGYDAGEYKERAFFSNIWDNILDAKVKAEKALPSTPVTLSLGLEGILETKRSFVPDTRTDTSDPNRTYTYNPGNVLEWGEWGSTFTLCASIGAKVWF